MGARNGTQASTRRKVIEMLASSIRAASSLLKKGTECFERLSMNGKSSMFQNPSVRPETCMMDVEPDRECSGKVARAIEPRRHCDERQDVYTTGLRCVCGTGR
jgi:hypothetical protein